MCNSRKGDHQGVTFVDEGCSRGDKGHRDRTEAVLGRGYKEGQGFQRGEGVGGGESQRHTLLNIIIMISNEVCGFK